MKKNLILKSFTAFIMASVILTSCLGDPEPVVLDGAADVFVQKIKQNNNEMYGLGFVVYANKGLETVSVKDTEGKTWSLKKDAKVNHIFYLLPEDEDYSETFPVTGDYSFTLKSTQENEEALILKDKLGTEKLGTVVIDSVKFINSKLELYWKKITGAHEYNVRLYDKTGELVFLGHELNDLERSYRFGEGDKGWLSSSGGVKKGEPYKLELRAIMYEAQANIYTKAYSVQFISIGTEEIVWQN